MSASPGLTRVAPGDGSADEALPVAGPVFADPDPMALLPVAPGLVGASGFGAPVPETGGTGGTALLPVAAGLTGCDGTGPDDLDASVAPPFGAAAEAEEDASPLPELDAVAALAALPDAGGELALAAPSFTSAARAIDGLGTAFCETDAALPVLAVPAAADDPASAAAGLGASAVLGTPLVGCGPVPAGPVFVAAV